jgi:hypothetical protein
VIQVWMEGRRNAEWPPRVGFMGLPLGLGFVFLYQCPVSFQGVDGRMGSKWTLGRLVGCVEWVTWLRTGTVGGLLWMRWWTPGFWRHGVSSRGVTVAACAVFNDVTHTAPGAEGGGARS